MSQTAQASLFPTKQPSVQGPWSLPSEWEWVPLGVPGVAEIIMGQSPPGESYNTFGEGLPFFQGKAEFGELSPVAMKWCTDPRKIALPEDILISVRAPVGPTNLASERCCIGRGLAAIRPTKHILPRYLLYTVRARESELSVYGRGSTFAAIGKDELSTFLIPIPFPSNSSRSLDIQRRIVARIEALLAELKEARALAVAIRRDTGRVMEAALAEMFTDLRPNWKKAELCKLIKLKSGEFLRSRELKTDGKFPVYGGNGIVGFYDKYLFEESKVVIGRVGAKCGCVQISEPRSWVTDNALYIEKKLVPLDDKFLLYLLSAANLNQYANRAAQPVISGVTLYPVVVRYPSSIDEQRTIAAYFDSIQTEVDEMHRLQVRDAELLNQVEQSILERAFRGEL